MARSTGCAVRDCLPAAAAEYRRPLPLPSRPALDRHPCCTPLVARTGTAKLGVRASSITFEDELLSKNFQVVKCAAFREELESGLKPTNFHQIDIEKV